MTAPEKERRERRIERLKRRIAELQTEVMIAKKTPTMLRARITDLAQCVASGAKEIQALNAKPNGAVVLEELLEFYQRHAKKEVGDCASCPKRYARELEGL